MGIILLMQRKRIEGEGKERKRGENVYFFQGTHNSNNGNVIIIDFKNCF